MLRASLEENGQLSGLRADILKQRAMEMLIESVEIVDEDGKAIDRADLEVDTDDADEGADEGAQEEDQEEALEEIPGGDDESTNDPESDAAMSDTGNSATADAVATESDDTGDGPEGDDE